MSKNQIRSCIILGVVLVCFCVVSLVVPFEKGAGFWIAFIFGVIAIGVQVYVFRVSDVANGNAKSRFFGFPILRIGMIYMVCQIALSFGEMALNQLIPAWGPVIVNIIILAIAVVGFISADSMRDEIVRQDEQVRKDVRSIRELQASSASLVGMNSNPALKKSLRDLADDFRYSDPVSSDATVNQENELKLLINEIQRAIVDGDDKAAADYCERTRRTLADRNRICKLNK